MKKHLWFLIAALVTLGLVATQCGPAPTPEVIEKIVTKEVEVEKVVTQEVEVEVEKEVEVLITPTPLPKDMVRYGGTFVEGWDQTLKTFNPWYSGQKELNHLARRIYSRLVTVTPDVRIAPELAESWEVSEDGKTYTFHLQEKATWHDGEPVTAADVKFTFERAAWPEVGSRWQPNAKLLEGGQDFLDGKADEVTGLKVLDEHTIQFVLTEPNAAFLSSFFNQFMAPKHIWEDIPSEEIEKSEYATTSPIGSGPWKVVNYVPDQILQLERHDGYFQEEMPYIDKYVYRIFQNQPAMVAALEAGEIDLAELAPADISRIEDIPYLGVWREGKRGTQILSYNLNLETWKDPQVRKAIAYAMDTDGICASAFLGACVTQQHTFPQSWTWSPKAAQYPYDPEKAKAMLEEAGFDFEKEYKLLTYYTGSEPVAIQSLLAEIGVKVEVLALDVPAYFEERVKDTWDMQYIGYFGSADPNDVAAPIMCTDDLSVNFLRYCNPEMDQLLDLGRTIVDFGERQKVYQQVDEIIQEDLPWFTMMRGEMTAGYNLRVANFQWSRNWHDFAERWYLYE